MGPIGPEDPVAPVAPAAPVAPVSPFGPWRPEGPIGPTGPAAPAAPTAPVAPISPFGPIGPAGPGSPLGPGGPIGPTVIIGIRVTLRSLFPAATSTLRTSAFQPGLGMETTTLCQPTETSVLMGVTLPVSFPSNDTFAPAGNELTFSLPW